MLLEGLVLTVCLQGRGGCNEASQAYYKGCPECQEAAKNGERLVKDNVNQTVLDIMAPVAGLVAGKGSIKLSNHWSIEVDRMQGGSLIFKWNY